jgi:capsular exopolysaccharide synthesis family protein
MAALRQRRKTLIATIVLIPLCAFLVLQQITPLYTATGSLIYEPNDFTLRELQSILRSDPMTEAKMASQAELLQSLHVAEEVTKRGNLFGNPEFNVDLRPPGLLHRSWLTLRWLLGMETDAPPPEPVYGPVIDRARERTMMAVQSALHATPVRYSHVVEVTFTAQDPVVAAAAVNNAMDYYIKGQYAAKHQMVEHANELLEKEARDLRQQVRAAETRITDYREKHGMSHGMHASTDSEEITHLTEDLVKARGDLANANARLDAARGNAGAAALAAIAPSVVQLRTQLERMNAAVQSQQDRLGSAHPEAQSLLRQRAETERALHDEITRVVAASQAEQRAAAGRVSALEADLRSATSTEDHEARAQIELDAMSRDLDAARSQLQAVLDRMQQTAQQAAVESSEAHEISQAIPPDRPSYPRSTQMMAAASVSAVFIGLMLVYLLHLADYTVHSGDELRTITGLPCFALIPEVSNRSLGHLPIHDYVARRPLTAFAEQVRALRAGLWFGGESPGHPRTLAITAARPSEGKSVLALALSRSAQLGGDRVLAIECDLRQPSFARRFGDDPAAPMGPGLANILSGEAAWRDCVRSDSLTGVEYIPSGRAGADILGLFMSPALANLLSEVRQDYDLTILDAPPVQAMTEARVIAAVADATLMCVRWRSTPRATLLNALEMLTDAHAKVIGTVLTRVETSTHLRSGYADAEVYHRRYKSYYRG